MGRAGWHCATLTGQRQAPLHRLSIVDLARKGYECPKAAEGSDGLGSFVHSGEGDFYHRANGGRRDRKGISSGKGVFNHG